MIELLQEILDAGKNAELPLNMSKFHCDTSCCICGDVAVMRGGDDFEIIATDFAIELDDASDSVFDTSWVASAIYGGDSDDRVMSAERSEVFTQEELNHPHLTTNHNDRDIAHDFVRLVMRKCEEQ